MTGSGVGGTFSRTRTEHESAAVAVANAWHCRGAWLGVFSRQCAFGHPAGFPVSDLVSGMCAGGWPVVLRGLAFTGRMNG